MSETVEHRDNTDMCVDFSRQRHGRAEHLIFNQQTSPIQRVAESSMIVPQFEKEWCMIRDSHSALVLRVIT